MSITETILVFVCIPLAVVLLIYVLVYGTSAARGRRYRPGRPFEPTAVWYVAGDAEAVAEVAETRELTAGDRLPVDDLQTKVTEWPEVQRSGETGGASDSW